MKGKWNLLKTLNSFYIELKINLKGLYIYLPKRVLRNYKGSITLMTPFGAIKKFTHKGFLPTVSLLFKSKASRFANVNENLYLNLMFNWSTRVVNSAYFLLKTQLFTLTTALLDVYRRSIGDGFIYLRGLFFIAFTDALITDDEPLWEPLEWSLLQSWIMFIFMFAWIAENLITSRYGSYTGRDKRVWFAWYKTFWWIEGYYLLSLGLAALFVITPFYHELTYPMPFMVSWWNWYSRVFFFKFTHTFTIILLIAYFLQINLRWHNWKTSFILILTINFFLAHLLYCHFFMTLFGYLTDPSWFSKNRSVDYIQLSHEPNKWAWGATKRDHFLYHRSTTVFWFKTDGPFSGALLFFHVFFFLFLFFLNFYWLTLARRVYATQEVTYTYTTYCVSSLRQFFYFFLVLHCLVFFSYVLNYWAFPVEFLWALSPDSWFSNFWLILTEYPSFILSIFIK